MTVRVVAGNALDKLREMPADSVHCCVTSPPYWGLRDYGVEPSVWGGDQTCEHEGAERRYYTEQSAAKTTGSSEAFSKPGEANKQRLKDARWRHDGVCRKCRAWRGAFGLEPTPDLYIEHLVEIFEEVRRVLRPEGTLWLNLGDSYATGAGAVGTRPGGGAQGDRWVGDVNRIRDDKRGYRGDRLVNTNSGDIARPKTRASRDGTHAGKHTGMAALGPMTQPNRMPIPGLKPKDLVGIPWMAAFALRRAGWWLRQDIIWSKPSPMPESVQDRCTKSHEYLFLLSKSDRYYYDIDAIREPFADASIERLRQDVAGQKGSARVPGKTNGTMKAVGLNANRSSYRPGPASNTDGSEHLKKSDAGLPLNEAGRNKRSVWEVTTVGYADAHFATFPPALIEPCILAGCPRGGIVLDPFGGAGTTGLVADRLQRDAILIELNPEYAEMARRRIQGDGGMFSTVAAE